MIAETLWWLLLFVVILAPVAVPWMIANLTNGRYLFTSLTASTGCIVGAGGKLVKETYKDKKGTTRRRYINDRWTYHRVIVPRGWSLREIPDDPDHPLSALAGKEEIVPEDNLDWSSPYFTLLRYLGVYWVGIIFLFQRVTYLFSWAEFSDDPDEPEARGKIITRREPTDFFYVGTTEYGVLLKDVEIGGNVKVDLEFSVFGRITIPELAFSRKVDWFQQLVRYLKSQATQYYRPIQYESVATPETDRGFEAVMLGVEPLTHSTKKDKDGNPLKISAGMLGPDGQPIGDLFHLEQLIGFRPEKVRRTEIGGELEGAIKQAAEAGYIAEKEGDAAIRTAERGVTVARLNAEAKELELKPYEGRRQFRKWEAYERMPGGQIVFDDAAEQSDEDKQRLAANIIGGNGRKSDDQQNGGSKK